MGGAGGLAQGRTAAVAILLEVFPPEGRVIGTPEAHDHSLPVVASWLKTQTCAHAEGGETGSGAGQVCCSAGGGGGGAGSGSLPLPHSYPYSQSGRAPLLKLRVPGSRPWAAVLPGERLWSRLWDVKPISGPFLPRPPCPSWPWAFRMPSSPAASFSGYLPASSLPYRPSSLSSPKHQCLGQPYPELPTCCKLGARSQSGLSLA